MKQTTTTNLLIRLTFAAALIALAGCASGNYQKASGTAADLTQSADKIDSANARIDATLSALNGLVGSTEGDLVPKYKTFNTAVGDLDSTLKEVRSKVSRMREKGNQYFQAWDEQLAQIKNEDIRNRSAERKTEVQNKFMDIKRSYTEVQLALEPFIGELKDIQTALSTDLTIGGLAAIKGSSDKVNKDAVALKASVDKLATEFRDLGVAMSSSAPAPQPAGGAK